MQLKVTLVRFRLTIQDMWLGQFKLIAWKGQALLAVKEWVSTGVGYIGKVFRLGLQQILRVVG